jgi:hypothetical protein
MRSGGLGPRGSGKIVEADNVRERDVGVEGMTKV